MKKNSASRQNSKVLRIRDHIHRCLYTLPTKACEDVIRPIFSPIFDNISHETNMFGCVSSTSDASDYDCSGMYVTPWIVACDKNQLSVLKFFSERYFADDSPGKFVQQVLGDPLMQSAREGNSAMHHAAMSDCVDAAEIFSLILARKSTVKDVLEKSHKEDINHDDGNVTEYKHYRNHLSLLSQANKNGDTPIMILSFANHYATLEMWIQNTRNFGLKAGLHGNDVQRDIADLVSLVNASNDSTLSLAYGHGNYKIVEFLIKDNTWINLQDRLKHPEFMDESLVIISQEDITKCKMVLEKLELVITSFKRDFTTESHLPLSIGASFEQCLERRDNIRRSLVMMQVSRPKLAEKRRLELTKHADLKSVAEKSRKKKDRSASKGSHASASNDKNISPTASTLQGLGCYETWELRKPIFTTVSDGTIVRGKETDAGLLSAVSCLDIHSNSIDNIFKDRCAESQNKITNVDFGSEREDRRDAEATLET